MSLRDVRDEFLARRAQHGDDGAFAELARRYEPLIAAATRRPPDGLDADDARQAALIGLYGHVIDELDDAPRIAAEDAIRAARHTPCVPGVSSEDGGA